MRGFRKDGFIAVISAVIAVATLFLVAVGISNSLFLSSMDTLGLETKETSYRIAEGCLEHARLNLASSSLYSGNETVSVDAYACRVRPIVSGGGQFIIEASSTIGNITTNLKLTVQASTLKTLSLEEVGSF